MGGLRQPLLSKNCACFFKFSEQMVPFELTFAGLVDAAMNEVLCFHRLKGICQKGCFCTNLGKTVVDKNGGC